MHGSRRADCSRADSNTGSRQDSTYSPNKYPDWIVESFVLVVEAEIVAKLLADDECAPSGGIVRAASAVVGVIYLSVPETICPSLRLILAIPSRPLLAYASLQIPTYPFGGRQSL